MDNLFKISKKLSKLEIDFNGSKELRIYLKTLLKITETAIDKVYQRKKTILKIEREESRESSFTEENVQKRSQRDFEYDIMALCENYSGGKISRKEMKRKLKKLYKETQASKITKN